MNRRSVLLVVCGTACAVGQEDYVVRSNANLVLLDVSVLGSGGVPVAGLGQDRFSVFEDGRKQAIKQFSGVDTPVTMGFVLDMSGSMENKVGGVRRAVNAFLAASNPDDEYFLVGFNDQARFGLNPETAPFTHDSKALRSAMYGMEAKGRTALYDGLSAALSHIGKSKFERRFLVLVSDGRDTASRLKLDDILFEARTHPVTVFTIGLFQAEDEDRNSGVLKQLAKITGGRYYNPVTAEQIESACLSIAKDIRARYTIGYTPAEEDRDGVRRIRVEVARMPDAPRMSVRARTEYRIRN
ncbi:hypothetical protein F183_A18760 [Bryobacterales bacterium F-183]|nr:hypothetical protein F183_A18760 [Bryobacterales bacterium F-183]